MKAVGFYEPLPVSDERSLVDLDVPVPTPRPRDLIVAVRSIGMNPVDVKRRRDTPASATPRILGFDCAGIVEAVGTEVSLFRVGDEVFYSGAVDRPGTNAEFHAVDERLVGRKPASLSFAEAAAIPLTSITAWELLFDRLGVPCGEKTRPGTLLVINGAGGVGSILIQIARRLTGLTIVATASRPETIEWCQTMGAHHVIDHRPPLDETLKGIGIDQAEYVASLTATDKHLPAIVRLIAPQGRMAVIDDPATLDILPFKRKSVSVHWELMFTRSLFQTADMVAQHRLLNEVAGLVDAGLLRTTLKSEGGTITAANLRAAHAALESGRSIGKTVLSGF